ncbi:MAG: hypothetical protein AAB566_01945 [Patescibacteria group bacterium]
MIKFILSLSLFLAGLGIIAKLTLANEINVFNRPSPLITQPLDIREKIQAGLDLLKHSQPLALENKIIRYKSGKVVITNETLRKQIALAIFNTKNGAVFEKRVWVKEDEIKNYGKTKMLALEPVEAGEPLDIQPKYWNSFNTFYEVEGRPELIVVANKYLLESKYLTGLPEKSKNKYSEIFYVPYSTALHRPELVEAGKRYIEARVETAFTDLTNHGLFQDSTSNPVSKEFVKTIMLVEHVDPDSFFIAADGGKELTERVLVIIGANQKRAYRYTGSPAGANGLAQFIKPTYNTIVRNYPSAGLIADYALGMADHTNAIKAMVLFFDAYKKNIVAKIADKNILNQLGITEEMLAATYNGGPNRVIRAVNNYGLAWLGRQLELPKSKRNFKTETLDYIKKFLAIRELKI